MCLGWYVIPLKDPTKIYIACGIGAVIGSLLGMIFGDKFFDLIEKALGLGS